MALISPVLIACAACVQTSPEAAMAVSGTVRVTNAGQPWQMWDGAAARKAADATCGPRGVRSSIYDRYDRSTGEWVYPGGCA
jgi:hypothetical protein